MRRAPSSASADSVRAVSSGSGEGPTPPKKPPADEVGEQRDLQRRMKGTVWMEGGCASWYIDENGLNTSLWPDFAYKFRRELRRFDLDSYEHQAPVAPVAERAPAPIAVFAAALWLL